MKKRFLITLVLTALLFSNCRERALRYTVLMNANFTPTEGSEMSHNVNHYTCTSDDFKVGQQVGLWEDETWYHRDSLIMGSPFHPDGHFGKIIKKDTIYLAQK